MSERKKISDNCPPGETCELEDILIREIAVAQTGAVDKANVTIYKNEGGKPMSGKTDETTDNDIEKKSLKAAAKEAVSLIEDADISGEKTKKRVKLLIANLKSLAGVKKADDDLLKSIVDLVELLEKADKFAKDIKSWVYPLPGSKKKQKPEEYEGYDYEGYKGEKTEKSNNGDPNISNTVKELTQLVQDGYVKPKELTDIFGEEV